MVEFISDSKRKEIIVVKEIPFPTHLNPELVAKWANSIPLFSENDPENPEWEKTPVHEISYKGRKILIKDESVNPTGTMKDRPAWEMACLYRDLARACLLRKLNPSDLKNIPIPPLSIMTSGNAGKALAELFKKFDLPPPRLLIGDDINEAILAELERLYANIYQIDLNRLLSDTEILKATNNQFGKDITSDQTIEPQVVFYDWLVHEVFNCLNTNPGTASHIYMPYGSGRLFESFLYWQVHSIKQHIQSLPPDPRLQINPIVLLQTSLHGAEPLSPDSNADKLTAKYKPFLIYQGEEAKRCIPFQQTGKQTAIDNFKDHELEVAFKLFSENEIKSEKSAAAGLALAISDIEKGLIEEDDQIIVINTGKGLIAV